MCAGVGGAEGAQILSADNNLSSGDIDGGFPALLAALKVLNAVNGANVFGGGVFVHPLLLRVLGEVKSQNPHSRKADAISSSETP